MWDVPCTKALPPATVLSFLYEGHLPSDFFQVAPVVGGSAAGGVPGDGELSRVGAGHGDAADRVVRFLGVDPGPGYGETEPDERGKYGSPSQAVCPMKSLGLECGNF